jgi:hypothetical protein
METHQSKFYKGEDDPCYKVARIVLYATEGGPYFYLNKETYGALTAQIQERDTSIMFTIARTLLT